MDILNVFDNLCFKLCICSRWVHMWVQCVGNSEKSAISHGAVVTGSCEQCELGTGNQT